MKATENISYSYYASKLILICPASSAHLLLLGSRNLHPSSNQSGATEPGMTEQHYVVAGLERSHKSSNCNTKSLPEGNRIKCMHLQI